MKDFNNNFWLLIQKRLEIYFSSFFLRTIELLKAHWQISKKRRFERYCSCDKACQFPALQGKP